MSCPKKPYLPTPGHNELFNTLLKWGYKRHARKGKRWIVSKYFTQVGGDHWRFHATIKDKSDQDKTLILRNMQDTKIWRHTKIKAAVTPFNPEFKEYFDERKKSLQRWRKTIQKSGLAGQFD